MPSSLLFGAAVVFVAALLMCACGRLVRHIWWIWACPRCGRRIELTRPWHEDVARSLHEIVCTGPSTLDHDGRKGR